MHQLVLSPKFLTSTARVNKPTEKINAFLIQLQSVEYSMQFIIILLTRGRKHAEMNGAPRVINNNMHCAEIVGNRH